MKSSVILGLLTLFVVGEAGLLGDKECTYGPTYWCESLGNAKQCVAVKHCIQTVWEKQKLPEDNDDVCSICKDMVQQARDQLLSNETQEEIREVFERSCELIPITVISEECIRLSDEFIPELIDTLASQMNPQVVCATAGLCNSVRMDRLIRQYKNEHGDASFAPAQKATPLPVDCQDCKSFIKDVVQTVKRHSRAELLDHLLAICGRLSSLSDGCMALVQSNFENIYQFLTQGLNPNEVCTLFGMCEGLYGTTLVPLPKTGDEPCDFCVAIVQNWRNNLIANTTKEEFKMILDGICHQMGRFEPECTSLVDQYFEPVYDIFVSEIEPKEICEAFGLCGVHSIFRNEVPLWPLIPVELKDRLPLVPLRPSFDKNELMGQDEANSYRYNAADLPRVSISKPSVNVVVLGEKGILEVNSQKSNLCVMCEFTLHFLQNVLNDKETREEIEEAVENVCKYLPHSVSEECEDYIEAYGDQVIQLIILEIDPATICPMLKLCPGNGVKKGFEKAPKPVCVLCEYVMTELDQILSDKSNEESIKKALDRVCTLMPKTVRANCVSFVDEYVNEIVDLIINDVTPDQICQALGLCSGKPTLLPIPDPADAQLPISRLFLPGVMIQRDFIEEELSKPMHQSAGCIICEFIMAKLDSLLLQNATESEIKNAVDKVCLLLPSTLMNDCLGFMDEYADSLIELIVNNLEPSFVCRKMKFCGDNFLTGLPKTMVQSPVDKCLMCEKLMSRVAEDPMFEGTTQDLHILMNVCRHLPSKPEKACSELVINYGEYFGKLLKELKDNKRVCQALSMCPFHGRKALLGKKKCTWGPSYWCQTKLHAEACKATEHCVSKVWGRDKPAA